VSLYWLIFYSAGVMGDRNLHCGNRNFGPFFLSCDLELDMTFTYELKPYPLETYGM